MRFVQHFIGISLILLCVSGYGYAQNSNKNGEKELIEAFVNLQDVPEPFATQLAGLKSKGIIYFISLRRFHCPPTTFWMSMAVDRWQKSLFGTEKKGQVIKYIIP